MTKFVVDSINKWQTKKIGELLIIKHGRNQNAIESKDGVYPILGTGGEMGRTNTFLCNKPSVLIGRKGTIDKPRYMDTPFWTVDTLFYSDINSENCAKFLFYVFCSIDWYKYNEASGVPSLSASTVSSIKVVVPEKPEQERIVSVLETWDNYLELLDKKITLKEQLKKGLMQQLLTGKKRLPGFLNEWDSKSFLEIIKIIPKPIGLKSDEYEKLGLYKIFDQSKDKYFSGYTSDVNYCVSLNSDVILFGDHSRVIKYIYKENVAFGNDGIKLFAPMEGFDAYFAFIMLKEYKIPNTGYNRHYKYLVDAEFEVPSYGEQRAISEIIKFANDEINILNDMKYKYNLQKKYLLKNLITGTIRTPENLTKIGETL
jgi:type I restriction enzyme, S subunit